MPGRLCSRHVPDKARQGCLQKVYCSFAFETTKISQNRKEETRILEWCFNFHLRFLWTGFMKQKVSLEVKHPKVKEYWSCFLIQIMDFHCITCITEVLKTFTLLLLILQTIFSHVLQRDYANWSFKPVGRKNKEKVWPSREYHSWSEPSKSPEWAR